MKSLSMDYIAQYQLLTQNFDLNKDFVQIEGLSVAIYTFRFTSNFSCEVKPPEGSEGEEVPAAGLLAPDVPQNRSFRYPVVVSEKAKNADRAILLLHGLNERSWNKYLVWAYYLSEQTAQPVVLFPLAFHINRSPEQWTDSRAMSQVVNLRKTLFSDVRETSFLNAALSSRIDGRPEQFVVSGMQSYQDVLGLMTSVREGNHPLLPGNARINIFSYSIGSFLSELLVMDNPRRLFDGTKLCIFCGGSTFDRINGTSRFIMDSRAFQRLHSITCMENFPRLKKCLRAFNSGELKHFWDALRYMSFLKKGISTREKIFRHLGERVYAIGLARDQVFPPSAILATIRGEQMNLPTRVDIVDFPYAYTHESPFPVNNEQILAQVDACFRLVFDKVSGFLK